VDPLLVRLMRASDQATSDTGQPEAIQPDELDFYFSQAAIDREADVPAVRVRLALDLPARQAIEDMGIHTYGRLDGFASALVPVTQLQAIASLPGVGRLQAIRIPKKELDVSRPEVLSTQVEATFGSRGRGVILGSIDTGIDWKHGDFRNADGTTRIKYIWSQDNSCVGIPPPPPFDWGCLYTEADINAALAGGPAISAPDAEGHGTHTIGVAAGNGRGTGHGQPALRYVGMAPEADIIVVKTFPEPTDTNGCSTCYDISAGMDFIDAKAAELGKPYVINLSIGSQFGGHDGSDLDEMTIDALTGPGRRGKAIVKSAGNDRGHAIHIGGTVIAGQTNTHSFTIPAYTPLPGAFNDTVAWSLWYNHGDNLTVTIADPTTAPCGSSILTLSATTGQGQVFSSTTSGLMVIDDSASPAPNGARFFEMQVDDQGTSPPCRGTWQLRVRGNSITSTGRYDAWIWFSSFGATAAEALWTAPDPSRLISIPGTAFNVTSVGSYTSKSTWQSIDGNSYRFVTETQIGALNSFSSPGPTRDGRIKPDLNAPGSAIVSTLSIDAAPRVQLPQIVEDGVHWSLPGTSFSSAHVAGVYAQILALKPNLDAVELRSLVTSTARVDSNVSVPLPNNDWGYGKLNALGAAQVECPTEICDGLDNDCDGTVDNGFNVGANCTAAVDACHEVMGRQQCRSDGTGTQCTGEVHLHDATAPVITCPAEAILECPGRGADIGLAGAADTCDPAPRLVNNAPALLPLGTTVVTWTATDASGNQATCQQSVLVRDSIAPAIVCPSDVTSECPAQPVPGIASATDACDPAPIVVEDAPASFPLGTTMVVWHAADMSGNTRTCNQSVSMVDTTPPMLTVMADSPFLWPPNHDLVPVHLVEQVRDSCDPNPMVTLVSVTSSEPDDAPGMGDGNTTGDIAGVELGTADGEVDLRAERAGTGSGRVYQLSYQAVDASGNNTPAFAVVTVPHDRGSGPEPLLLRLEAGGTPGMVHIYWAGIPGALGYDVISGDLSQAKVENGKLSLGAVRVLARGTTETSLAEDSSGVMPATGTAIFYLIQSRTDRGGSGYGTESAPWPRVPEACEGGCP
jgi:hypothetical protein